MMTFDTKKSKTNNPITQIEILMENIMSINYNEIYRCNTFLLYLSVYTDKSISSMYTNRITVRKEEMKKKLTCLLTYSIANEINLWLIFVSISVGNI